LVREREGFKEAKMRKILVSLVVMLSIAGGSLVLVPSVSAQDLWTAGLVPCDQGGICGNYPANVATRGMDKAVVTVDQSGLVVINITKLAILATGEIDANKTLDVFLGSFPGGLTFQGRKIGTITTDADGNFAGNIDTGGGIPFGFDSGTTVDSSSVEFVLNDPGVRSEFVTGFTVP
jgi:hypothetical protein